VSPHRCTKNCGALKRAPVPADATNADASFDTAAAAMIDPILSRASEPGPAVSARPAVPSTADVDAVIPRVGTRRAVLLACAAHTFAIAVIAALWMLATHEGLPFSALTRDPATELKAPFVVGWLSYAGAVMWCTAAAVGLFSAAALALPTRRRRFVLASGLLSALLLADDLFMIHDGVVPFILGDIEGVMLGIYGVLLSAYFYAFRTLLRETHWPLLLLSLAFFAASVTIDAGVIVVDESRRHLFEDGAKLLGIMNWCGFVVGACARFARPADGRVGVD